MARRPTLGDFSARPDELEAAILAAAAKPDLAADGEERSDGHHHPAEAASDAEMREHDLRLQGRLRERQDQIDRARRAIEAGTYGVCVECGGGNPEGRPPADPGAPPGLPPPPAARPPPP